VIVFLNRDFGFPAVSRNGKNGLTFGVLSRTLATQDECIDRQFAAPKLERWRAAADRPTPPVDFQFSSQFSRWEGYQMNSTAGDRTLSRIHGNTNTMQRFQKSVVFLVVVLLSHSAWAGNLEDVIPGLYGGDGVRLQTPPNNHAAQFTSPDGGEFQEIGNAIASGVNLVSAGAVVSSFRFDPAQAVFVRSDEGLGDMIAELADTIGKGNLSIGSSYTRFDFKSFEGEDLNSVEVDFDHADLCGTGNPNTQVNPDPDPSRPRTVPIRGQLPSVLNDNCFLGIAPNTPGVLPSPNNPNFERDSLAAVLDIELTQEIFAFFANYGILDNWDIGLVIPVVHTDISASSVATINRSPLVPNSNQIHNFCTPELAAAGINGCDQGTRLRDRLSRRGCLGDWRHRAELEVPVHRRTRVGA
jgi:hypothetical protein